MVKELRLIILVLTVLMIPLFVSSIEILISGEVSLQESNSIIDFETDEIGSCFFILGESTTVEAVQNLFNYSEEENSYCIMPEEAEYSSNLHEIIIDLECCKEFTQGNCYGAIACCGEDYFNALEEGIGFEEDVINVYCNSKPISFEGVSEYQEPAATTTATPVPTLISTIEPTPTSNQEPEFYPTSTPIILPSPTDSPIPAESPEYQMAEEEICIPDCTNRVCGDDGCGGKCGVCFANEQCYLGECISYGKDADEEKVENKISSNFNNNSILNSSEELVFQTSQESICFFNDGTSPINLESNDGMLHTFPKSHLAIGENKLSISCITVDDSIEDRTFYSFEIAEDTKAKKGNISIIIIIASIFALVFTISTILIVIFLISPKRKESNEKLTTPIKFQQEINSDLPNNKTKQIVSESKKRILPKKHLDHIFDQFLDDNLGYRKRHESSEIHDNADSRQTNEEELEQFENSQYIDLTDITKKGSDNYKNSSDDDNTNNNNESKNNVHATKDYNKNGNDENKKQDNNPDDESQDESLDKDSLDPTKELARVMIRTQLANKDPLSSEDIIDIIRHLGLKNSSQVSALFSTLLNQGKAKKEQLLIIIQDMRKFNIIDEMQALEILSESNLLD